MSQQGARGDYWKFLDALGCEVGTNGKGIIMLDQGRDIAIGSVRCILQCFALASTVHMETLQARTVCVEHAVIVWFDQHCK